jgi:hypothetical protein
MRPTAMLLRVLSSVFLAATLNAQVFTSGELSRLRSVESVALSPDGHYIAYTVAMRDRPGRPYGQLWVMDLSTQKTIRLGGDKPAGSPLWSHDGHWIAFHGADGDKNGLLIAHPDGSGATFLAPTAGTNSPLPGTGADFTWSPDGNRSRSSHRRPDRRPPRPAEIPRSSPDIFTSPMPVKGPLALTTTNVCTCFLSMLLPSKCASSPKATSTSIPSTGRQMVSRSFSPRTMSRIKTSSSTTTSSPSS